MPEPNRAWNTSTTSLGFWYRYVSDEMHPEGEDHRYDPDILDTVHEDCQWYTDAFEEMFIDSDRTWKVARIMARVSGGGSLASALLSWTFVGPFFCPVHFLWPGVFLPLVMISFLAEGSKFLFFDMGICRNSMFEEAGKEEGALPEPVESCTMGDSAIHGLIATVLLLVSLLLVCLKVPEERTLDPHFGIPSEDTDPSDENNDGSTHRRVPSITIQREKPSSLRKSKQEQQPIHFEEQPPIEPSPYAYDNENDYDIRKLALSTVDKEDNGFSRADNSFSSCTSKREPPRSAMDSSFQSRSDGLHTRHHCVHEILGDITEEEGSTLSSVVGNSVATDTDNTRISESRLSTLASVEKKAAGADDFSTASIMLEDLVQDLNISYSYPPQSQFDGGSGGREHHALSSRR